MKIKYKKKRIKIGLFITLGYFFIVSGWIYRLDTSNIIKMLLPILYLSLAIFYYYSNYMYYLIIKDGVIKKYPFGQSIKVSDIKEVREFAGDYILKFDKSNDFTINTQIIEPNSLAVINKLLEKPHIKWDSH